MDQTTILLAALGILWTLLGIVSNGFIVLFWQRIRKLEDIVEVLQKETAGMRLNYLDRFDDLKEVIKAFELKMVEKMSILETAFNEHKEK